MNFLIKLLCTIKSKRAAEKRRKKIIIISTNMAMGEKAEPFMYSFNLKGIADSDKNIHFSNSFTT